VRAALKMMQCTLAHAQKHYDDLKERPFFAGLCEYSACPPCAGQTRPRP